MKKSSYYDKIVNFTPSPDELAKAKDNMGLAVTILKQFKGLIPDSDLTQAGYLGLLRAVHDYRPEKGKFSPYAAPWIRQAMRFEVEASGRTVTIPLHIINRLYKVQRTIAELSQKLHREPTVSEIAEHIGCHEPQVEEALAISNNTSSLNAPQGVLDESVSAIDSLVDPSTVESIKDEVNQNLHKAINKLWPLERAIIIATMFENKTYSEIGRQIGRSGEFVRKKKQSAIVNLRYYMHPSEIGVA